MDLPDSIIYDGFNMLPVLTGKETSKRETMFWNFRGDQAARMGNWKWVRSQRGTRLFDLSKDIGEKNDLREKKPQILHRITAAYKEWEEKMDSAEPRGPFKDF